MEKKRIYHIIEWLVTIVACGYLGWRLVHYDGYDELWATIVGMGEWQWCCLLVAIILMPVNMSLEAWRWRYLMGNNMSWREAHRQVYYSKLAGLITPWHIGEYPARAVIAKDGDHESPQWSKTLSMGAIGSATMTAAILISGLIGLLFSPDTTTILGDSYLYKVGIIFLLLVIGMRMLPRILRRYAKVDDMTLLVSTGQSMVRLGCWCGQLLLIIAAISCQQSAISLGLAAVYYLLVTITPNVPIAEVGVRGAWAIVVFGSVDAGLAGVLLWVINSLGPCVVWLAIRRK